MVADIIWLQRFACHPAQHEALNGIRAMVKPEALAQILYNDFSKLSAERKQLDSTIMDWCDQLTAVDLDHKLFPD